MKKLIGIVIVILSVFLCAYVAGWLMFIGGIVDAFNMFNGTMSVTGLAVALAIGKIFLASTVAGLSTILGILGIKIMLEV